jgi:tape measure domain-containing protein
MAIKDTALNIVIRAKDLTRGTLAKFRKDLDKTEESAERASSGLSKLATRAGQAVAAFVGFETIRRSILAVLTTGDKFEKLGIQLSSVMGSLEEGERATAWIKDFTRNTPLQLEQVTEAFITLKNFGLDPQNGTLQAIVDQNEKLGGGYERLIGITRALGQAQAKQKLQGEEILQLVERGVPVWALLAEVTGKSTAELNKMSSAGELGTDVINQLIQAMGEQSTGAAAKNMSTLSGLVSNLKDTWQNFLNTVAESGALDYARDQLKALSDRIAVLGENGTLTRWAKEASDAIIALGQGIKATAGFIVSALPAIKAFGLAWAAVKLKNVTADLLGLGVQLGTKIPEGARKAALSLNGLKFASLAGGAAFFITQLNGLVDAFQQLRAARKALDDSLSAGAKVEEEAARRIQQYQEQTGFAASSLDDLIAAQESGIAVFDAANEQWITGRDAVEAYKASLESTEDAVEQTADTLSTRIAAAAENVVREFAKLRADGDSTDKALDEIFKGRDLTVTQDVLAVVTALQSLKDEGQITATELETGLGAALKNLTANELRAFQINAEIAFAEGRINAQAFAETIDGTVRAALERLSVDITKVETGISGVGTKAIADFNLITQSIEKTGASGEQQAEKVKAAFLAAFAQIETKAGREELLAGLRNALDAGIINLSEFNALLDQAGLTALGTEKSFDQVGESAKRATSSVRELGQASREAGTAAEEGASRGGGAYAIMTGAIQGYTEQVAALSDATRARFVDLATGVKGAGTALKDDLNTQLAEANARIKEIRLQGLRTFDATGLQGALGKLGTSAAQATKEFLQQKIAVTDLGQSYESGAISAESFVVRAEQAVGNARLLDQATLDQFRGQIAAARAEMERLRDSTQSTMASLQDELDQLRGNTAAIEERRFQARIQELEEQLAYAEAVGEEQSIRAAQESLRLAQEIKRVKDAERQAAQAERRAQQQERLKAQSGFNGGENSRRDSTPGVPSNNRTIRLDLQSNGQPLATLNGVDEREARALLDALERAGLNLG